MPPGPARSPARPASAAAAAPSAAAPAQAPAAPTQRGSSSTQAEQSLPLPPPPPPLTDADLLRAQHWPADPALHPAPHAPVRVRMEGRAVWVDGCDTPLLAGLSPQAFVSSPGEDSPSSPPLDLVLGFHAASGEPTPSEDIPLGLLGCVRFLAGARSKLWWMFPAWGATGAAVPPETQFLLAEVGPGLYAALTPLIDGGAFRGTLRAAR
jgi:hypothetical protein